MYIKNNGIRGWEVRITYHDIYGKKKQAHKRGFATKREAEAWGKQFYDKQNSNLDMSFESFWGLYRTDMQARLRENTMRNKDYIVELKILPYFGKKKVLDITAADIRKWQGEMLKQGYSQTYLKSLNNQLVAIFNYASKYYDIPKNPAKQAGTMGKNNAEEMLFWTPEEFELFSAAVKDKPVSYYSFLTLFWTGCRIGELLALQLRDFNPEGKTLIINKSLQRIGGTDFITGPKTEKSKRVIALPDFLVEELKNYVNKLYGIFPEDRLFNVSKSYLEKEMRRGVELAGVKKIRIHDLRHSHASFLISCLGADPQLVAARLGHEQVSTTLAIYAHLYPNKAGKLAEEINAFTKTWEED